jgi:hypothetical protein
MEAPNYHGAKDIAFTGLRVSLLQPKLAGWKPRYSR